MAFIQAGEEMGYDFIDVNGAQQTGFSFYQFTMRRGSRCSDAKAFLRPVRLRKNLHVALFSHVTKVIFDEQSRRALGVEFIRYGVKHNVYAKREVILAAGAINSPHLLMLSGIGPRADLERVGVPVVHDSPGVGKNLQDHPAIGGLVFKIDHQLSLKFSRLFNINSALRYATTEDGPLTSSIGLEVTSFINTKYANHSDDWPDMNLFFTSASTPSDPQVKVAHGLKEEFYNEVYRELEDQDVFGIFPMMLRPRSRECVVAILEIGPPSELLLSKGASTHSFSCFRLSRRWFHQTYFKEPTAISAALSQLLDTSGRCECDAGRYQSCSGRCRDKGFEAVWLAVPFKAAAELQTSAAHDRRVLGVCDSSIHHDDCK